MVMRPRRIDRREVQLLASRPPGEEGPDRGDLRHRRRRRSGRLRKGPRHREGAANRAGDELRATCRGDQAGAANAGSAGWLIGRISTGFVDVRRLGEGEHDRAGDVVGLEAPVGLSSKKGVSTMWGSISVTSTGCRDLLAQRLADRRHGRLGAREERARQHPRPATELVRSTCPAFLALEVRRDGANREGGAIDVGVDHRLPCSTDCSRKPRAAPNPRWRRSIEAAEPLEGLRDHEGLLVVRARDVTVDRDRFLLVAKLVGQRVHLSSERGARTTGTRTRPRGAVAVPMRCSP